MSKSYLLSFAKAKGNMAAVALAAILMAANATVASAQNKATESKEIERTVIGGVEDLTGIDPSSADCANGTNVTDGNKILYLYNVGAKKFLGVGGKYGTQATLDVSPYSIYMYWNRNSKTIFLESKVGGSGSGRFLGIAENAIFMDRGGAIVTFEQGKDYNSDTNKVYLINIAGQGYLTACPDNEDKICNYQKKAAEDTQEYKNQEWKVITKNEYYELFKTTPANMKSVVDASFLIACPDFRVNDTDAAKWKIEGKSLPADVNSHVRFGDEKTYRTYNNANIAGTSG